jgi:hypothetical protein
MRRLNLVSTSLGLFSKSIKKFLIFRFVWISKIYEPIGEEQGKNIYITRSYDPSSHFESVCQDVKDVYKRIIGHDLQLKQRPSAEEEQEKIESSLESMSLSSSKINSDVKSN